MAPWTRGGLGGPWLFRASKGTGDRQGANGGDAVTVRKDAIDLWQSKFDQVAKRLKNRRDGNSDKNKVE